jgi:hypothetical protein
MTEFSLRENGRNIGSVTLPNVPHRGDVISNSDPKLPVYLVELVEMFDGNELVTLHVTKFSNQLSAQSQINCLH